MDSLHRCSEWTALDVGKAIHLALFENIDDKIDKVNELLIAIDFQAAYWSVLGFPV